jgi:DNA-binding HxlR family transcriptional regulator
MLGLKQFGEFEHELGLAPSLLGERLAMLVDNGMLMRHPLFDGARRQLYRLTTKGLAVMPVFATSNTWANRWFADPKEASLRIVHRDCLSELEPVWYCDTCGERLSRTSIHFEW